MVLSLISLPVSAANIETVLMPGKVIEGHAKNEADCTSCHARFSKQTQNPLCLDCHKKVNQDIEKKSGFHGRTDRSGSTPCSSCHTDHKGREASIVLLEREMFDHNLTDFSLRGGHRKVECTACHKQGKKWREAPSECISCHRSQDIHEGEFGKQCADCHNVNHWGEQKFDHDTTDFPLQGAHDNVLCAACHPNQRYKESPKECSDCHRVDDIHNGGYGDKCESCHRTEKWKTVEFDHEQTDFTLRHAHQQVACISCHKPGSEKKKISTSCVSCHRNDDTHKGRNGENCQDCHSSKTWKKSPFNHNKETKFPLRGPHAKANCNACHANGIKKDVSVRECVDCHEVDDIHKNELGTQCNSCHRVDGWLNKIRFDHDLSQFPLYGLHALTSCESCHTKGKYAALPTNCNDCHQDDDSHKGGLGTSCNTCHNANSWKLWRYDHEQTRFPLSGSHEGLACNTCHKDAPADKTPSNCVSCHENDDTHNGRFGRSCSRCHTTEKFSHVRVRQ